MDMLWTKGSSETLAGRSAEVMDGRHRFHVMFQEAREPPTMLALAESYRDWAVDKGAREVMVRLMNSGVEAEAHPFRIASDAVTQLDVEDDEQPDD